jgi:NAD+ synthase
MDCKKEKEARVSFVKKLLEDSGCKGIVVGLSGGKDMPCESSRNYNEDAKDAAEVADKFGIKTLTVDLTSVKEKFSATLKEQFDVTMMASANMNPRLRMITVYAYALSNNMLVAGTGNASEAYMGYFTKWGDGAYDFNVIGDMTVTEIYELLGYLGAPDAIMKKAPSAALFEGQTDEGEMGVTYKEIDAYLAGKPVSGGAEKIIKAHHARSEHKRANPPVFKR